MKGIGKRILSEKSIVMSIISIVFSSLGLIGFFEIFQRIFSINNLNIAIYIVISGLIGIYLIFLSIYREIKSLSMKEQVLFAGSGIQSSKYTLFNYLDNKNTQDITIVAQNMSTLVITEDFCKKIEDALKSKKRINFFLAPYKYLKILDPKYGSDLVITVNKILKIYNDIGKEEKERLIVKFHRNALNLSSMFINAETPEAIAIITPKSTFDDPPKNRLYIVIDSLNNRDLYNTVYGPITNMQLSNSTEIDDEIREMEKDNYFIDK
jgi:hypothetical protein